MQKKSHLSLRLFQRFLVHFAVNETVRVGYN